MKSAIAALLLIASAICVHAQIPGNSLQLKANGNFVSIPDVGSTSLNNTMTWEFWLYYRCENGTAAQTVITKGWCGATWSYFLLVENGKLAFHKFNPSGSGTCPSAPYVAYESAPDAIPFNTWTHIAIVQSGTTVSFFRNGNPITATVTAGTPFAGIKTSVRPLLLGAYQNLAGNYVTVPLCNLDEVRIWHTARTPEEIQSNMNQEISGSEPGLMAYYKLNESGSGAGITCVNSASGSPIPNGSSVGTAANLLFTSTASVSNALPLCNPLVWYKADSAVFTDNGTTPATNGQSIQRWNDVSGNGYHLDQTLATKKPVLASTALNGKPALQFDGNDLLSTLSQLNWSSTNNNDIFIVCKNTTADAMLFESSPSTVANNGSFYVIDNYTQGGNGVSAALKGTNGAYRVFKNSTGFIPCAKIYQVSNDMSQPGSNAVIVKLNNNVMADDGGYNSGTPSGGLLNHFLYAGGRSDGTYGLAGYIAEMIAFPTKLTNEKASEVYAYLHQKYLSGNGTAQFNNVPAGGNQHSNTILNDDVWKHSYNNANPDQIIASVKDNCLDLGTRSDTVYVAPTAVNIGSAHALRRHYTIKTSLNPPGSKRVRLYYSAGDFADLQALVPALTAHNQLAVTKYNGSNEDGSFNTTGGVTTYIPPAQITHGSAFGQFFVEFDVNGFSEFWIHPESNTPLPVMLGHFEAEKCDVYDACLSWRTENEENFSHYILERSADAIRFDAVARIEKNQTRHYAYTDRRVNGLVYYRLNMVDLDGSRSYSKTLSLDFGRTGTILVSPNPANASFTVSGSGQWESIDILNAQGQRIRTIHATQAHQAISTLGMVNGIYFLRIREGENCRTEKLVIQKN